VLLRFDGIDSSGLVWLNGTYLGQHQGGYSRFRFSAAGSVRPGQDNVVAVRVNNAHNPGIAPLTADYLARERFVDYAVYAKWRGKLVMS